MENLIEKLESKVKNCNNTNTIFDIRDYVLLKDVKELFKEPLTYQEPITMTEEQMKEYVMGGKKLFTVKSIDTIRDGGNKVIDTTLGKYYIHKDTEKFHSDYPLTDVNIIADSLLIEYLIERIEDYIGKCQKDVNRNKTLLTQVQNAK